MDFDFDLKRHVQYEPLTYGAWRQVWNKTSNLEMLLGLLHHIFDTEVSLNKEECRKEKVERIVFLLRLADKHTSLHEEGRSVLSGPQSRLAGKAFNLLAENVFKHSRHSDEFYLRPGPSMDETLLKEMLHFFRPADAGGTMLLENLQNVKKNHHLEAADNYAYWMVDSCYSVYSRENPLEWTYAGPSPYRPQMIRILAGICKLDWLVWKNGSSPDDGQWILRRYDESTLKTLQELVDEHFDALGELSPSDGAAILFGIQAAQILVIGKAALAAAP